MTGETADRAREWLRTHDSLTPPWWWELDDDEWAETLEKLENTEPGEWEAITAHRSLVLAEANYVMLLDDVRAAVIWSWPHWLSFFLSVFIGFGLGRWLA